MWLVVVLRFGYPKTFGFIPARSTILTDGRRKLNTTPIGFAVNPVGPVEKALRINKSCIGPQITTRVFSLSITKVFSNGPDALTANRQGMSGFLLCFPLGKPAITTQTSKQGFLLTAKKCFIHM